MKPSGWWQSVRYTWLVGMAAGFAGVLSVIAIAGTEDRDPLPSRLAMFARMVINPAAAVLPEPALEQITARPVADRFDFVGAPIYDTIASLAVEPANARHDMLRPGVVVVSPPAHAAPMLVEARTLPALAPEMTLAASPARQVLGRSPSPQVAGWHMIRTIEITQPLSQADRAMAGSW